MIGDMVTDQKPTYKHCVGCIKETKVLCIFRHWGNRHLCPCGECLVKPMCMDECCIEREKAIDKMVSENPYDSRA